MIKQLLLCCLVAGGLFVGCKSKTDSDAPIAKFASQEFYKEFVTGPDQADQKYVGQIVQVQGTVIKKGVDTGERPYLNLAGDPVLGDVQLFFAQDQQAKAAEIAIGTSITVNGLCFGRRIHLTLDRCKFVE